MSSMDQYIRKMREGGGKEGKQDDGDEEMEDMRILVDRYIKEMKEEEGKSGEDDRDEEQDESNEGSW
ncbi:hypothetical protein E2C01_076107 [Portunus trituberculatus]|uniref:Uncharacterized protein n=1 Tax=Portunus trituberculatus TaxID=210409 RepID=A0A5B7II29_PORTR|nr:hypothetical protein [Portunus trituberculatus]